MYSSYSLWVTRMPTVLPLLVNSLFGLGTFFPLAVDKYLFLFVQFVCRSLACKLTRSSSACHLLHLHITRKNTRPSPIKYVLVLHFFSSLQSRLENDTHNYACLLPPWLWIPTYTLCNTMLTLGQRRLTCLGACPSPYQRMFLYVQALCFLHLLHKSFAALLFGFLSHMALMDFSFACIRNVCGVTGGGGSGNRPFHPTKDNTAPTMSRSIMRSSPICFPST